MAVRDELDDLKDEVKELRKQMVEVRLFQRWLMGVAAGIGALVAFLAQGIKNKLGLP